MITKQDIIRFVEEIKIESPICSVVIIAGNKGVYSDIKGRQSTLAAVLYLVAKENPDFKEILVKTGAFLVEEDDE